MESLYRDKPKVLLDYEVQKEIEKLIYPYPLLDSILTIEPEAAIDAWKDTKNINANTTYNWYINELSNFGDSILVAPIAIVIETSGDSYNAVFSLRPMKYQSKEWTIKTLTGVSGNQQIDIIKELYGKLIWTHKRTVQSKFRIKNTNASNAFDFTIIFFYLKKPAIRWL